MHVTDLLQPACVSLRYQADSLQAAVHKLTGLMAQAGNLDDVAAFEADVQKREALGGTCVGGGMAIPHAKSEAVRAPALAAITLDPPLACTTPDGIPLRMMFLIAAPAQANDLHVRVLAELATLLLDKELCTRLMQADTPDAFCRRIAEQENPSPQPDPPQKSSKPEH